MFIIMLCNLCQWDLVCDKNYWTETTQTMLVIGVLIGAVTMTGVADRFGRKRTFLMNSCASSFVVLLTAMVDNYYLFAALRLLLGVFMQVGFFRYRLYLSSSCCRSRSDKDCFHHLTLALHLSLCCESDVHESIFMSLIFRFLLMVSLNRRRGRPLFL